ncbi:type II toxin-antitoxin system MqsR family toxin [Cupriavidus basilensis]|uniref:type II toxin-antitoxin system MqsR family toxin n=1 Tax=Cupriavidus basilensis TaxID=68895 RepID=UPI000750FDC1|nr:type II toxin-antitoxin system MqsR family toxin [Cupriavidus basilensis]
MEKHRPHCKLQRVRSLIEAGRVTITFSALTGAGRMGLDEAGLLAVVMALAPHDFYKSMTTYADHTIWQDVYRPVTPYGSIYLKLTVMDEVLIVSFKER